MTLPPRRWLGADHSPAGEHLVFESGRKQAECPLQRLWVLYLGLGGTLDLMTLDAFLHGLVRLPPAQQDILARTINEQLDDRCRDAQVPHLATAPEPSGAGSDPLTYLDELLGGPSR
jgi:hypothetical protein